MKKLEFLLFAVLTLFLMNGISSCSGKRSGEEDDFLNKSFITLKEEHERGEKVYVKEIANCFLEKQKTGSVYNIITFTDSTKCIFFWEGFLSAHPIIVKDKKYIDGSYILEYTLSNVDADFKHPVINDYSFINKEQYIDAEMWLRTMEKVKPSEDIYGKNESKIVKAVDYVMETVTNKGMKYMVYTESKDQLFYDPTSWILLKDNVVVENSEDLIGKTVEFKAEDGRISSIKK